MEINHYATGIDLSQDAKLLTDVLDTFVNSWVEVSVCK